MPQKLLKVKSGNYGKELIKACLNGQILVILQT